MNSVRLVNPWSEFPAVLTCHLAEAAVKRLFRKHCGDGLHIASAYIDKALKWPQIKSDDGKALSAYAIFLCGCWNTMEDVSFLEEMVTSKLSY